MKVITLAAGLAAGYVLGTRAGRERYEQIVASARKVSEHPMVAEAQEKVKGLLSAGNDLGAGNDAAPVQLASVTDDEVAAPVAYPTPTSTRSSRRKTVTTAETTGVAPLM
jgi:hypothetical protein